MRGIRGRVAPGAVVRPPWTPRGAPQWAPWRFVDEFQQADGTEIQAAWQQGQAPPGFTLIDRPKVYGERARLVHGGPSGQTALLWHYPFPGGACGVTFSTTLYCTNHSRRFARPMLDAGSDDGPYWQAWVGLASGTGLPAGHFVLSYVRLNTHAGNVDAYPEGDDVVVSIGQPVYLLGQLTPELFRVACYVLPHPDYPDRPTGDVVQAIQANDGQLPTRYVMDRLYTFGTSVRTMDVERVGLESIPPPP